MDESPAWLAPSDEETMLLVVITESGLEKEIDLQITSNFHRQNYFTQKFI